MFSSKLTKPAIKLNNNGKRFYRKIKSFKQIPGPKTIPILGNLWEYKLGYRNHLNYHKVLDDLHYEYGPLVKEQLGPTTVVHVFSPDDVKTLYGEEGKMPDIVPFQETAQEFRKKQNLSMGLGNSNGDEWYRLRNAVRQLMLTPRSIAQFLPKTEQVCDNLIENLYKKRTADGYVIRLRDEIGKWIQESAGLVCFDKRLGYFSEENKEYVRSIMEANKSIFYLSGCLKFSVPFYKVIATPMFKRLTELEEHTHASTHKHTEEAFNNIKQLMRTNKLKEGQYAFLTTLLKRTDITEDDISSITHNLMIDGLSMSVPTMLNNLYNIASNEEVQEKAYKEISAVMKKGDPMTPTIMGHLSYLKGILKETFRFLPTGTEISRVLQRDVILSGYEVPKDTYVSINLNVHFKNEKYFKEPEIFRPERWIRGDEAKELANHRVLTPFGLGPRACIGRRFAEQDIFTGLAKVLLHFKLKYPKGAWPYEQINNTSLFPKNPLEIQFIPRD